MTSTSEGPVWWRTQFPEDGAYWLVGHAAAGSRAGAQDPRTKVVGIWFAELRSDGRTYGLM